MKTPCPTVAGVLLFAGFVGFESDPACANPRDPLERTHTLEGLTLEPAETSPNPWVGAGLGLAGVVSFAAVGYAYAALGAHTANQFALGNGGSAGLSYQQMVLGTTLLIAAPVGLGAGYVYGAEPMRGLWVSLGGLAVAAGSMFLGTLALGNSLPGYFVVSLPASALYSAWALVDTYQTLAGKAGPEPPATAP